MSEKRYLVYKNWNGFVHCSIEYGEHTTGEGKKKDKDELRRIELKLYDSNDLEFLKNIYPLEEVKDEKTTAN